MKGMMRKISLVTILLVSIGFFVVRNRALVARYNPLSQYKCDIPVTYVVGAVDPHFGIPQEKFVAMMREAEQKWESALGRDVFKMESDGRVKMNLTYDERQMTTENLKKINADIDLNKQMADQTLDSYKDFAAQYEQKKSSFNVDTVNYKQAQRSYAAIVSQYQKDLQAYDQSVSYWNGRGGATGNDYEKLIKQKKELDQRYESIKSQEESLKTLHGSLEKKRQEVNAWVDKTNAVAGTANKIIGKTNAEVADYNQTQAERGEFETGLYTNNQGVESIDIFQFADDKDLLAVLIHEMGHALGLDHAQNQTAIMYPKLINQSADITADDVALFNETCVR